MLELFLDTVAVVAGALCGLVVALAVIFIIFCALAGVAYILWLGCDWIAGRWSK